MIVRSTIGGENGSHAALMVDTHRPFALALDDGGWKKANIDPATLKLVPNDPEQKLREGEIPLLKLGAFDLKRVGALYGIPLGDLEKATQVDLDGIVGASLLYRYRCTFADGGRVLWIEDDYDEVQAVLRQGMAPPPPPAPAPSGAPGAGPPKAGPPKGPVNDAPPDAPKPPPPLPKK
jgi:hypothetical protein